MLDRERELGTVINFLQNGQKRENIGMENRTVLSDLTVTLSCAFLALAMLITAFEDQLECYTCIKLCTKKCSIITVH